MAIKLTVINVLTLADGKHLDTDRDAPPGFYLWVRMEGRSRIYVMRYTHMGVPREISMGKVRHLSLKDARQKARGYRAMLDRGEDPRPRQQEPAPRKRITVWDDCMRWYNFEKGAWSPSTQHTQMLWMDRYIGNPYVENYGHPALCGHLETAALTPAILAALFYRDDGVGNPDPTCPWIATNETAQRVISILQRAIDHAIANDDDKRFAGKMNPALSLGRRLPKGCRPDPVSRRAVKYAAARPFYRRLQEVAAEAESETQRVAAVALLTMIETFAPRAAEVFNMTWGEIKGNVWLIPAGRRGRMKNKRNSRVVRDIPFAERTLARLMALRPENAKPMDFVFRGQALSGRRLGTRQMCVLMQNIGDEFGIDATPHGWRTSAKTWGLDHARHVNDAVAIEIAQDRVVETVAGDRYRDTTYLAHRRILAERWICYLRGESYQGPYAPYALELVVDNENPEPQQVVA